MRIERDPYNSILLEAYNLYIADWCNTRGYALTVWFRLLLKMKSTMDRCSSVWKSLNAASFRTMTICNGCCQMNSIDGI